MGSKFCAVSLLLTLLSYFDFSFPQIGKLSVKVQGYFGGPSYTLRDSSLHA